MTKDELVAFLKQNISIRIIEDQPYGEGTKLTVQLLLDDEIISSDYVWL